jgi:phage terminase small subunit
MPKKSKWKKQQKFHRKIHSHRNIEFPRHPSTPGRKPGITPKMQRFIEQYLVEPNATKAALIAGYSPRSAFATGYDLTKKPLVREQIAMANKARSKKYAITADKVLAEMAKLAFTSLDDFMVLHPNGDAEINFRRSGPNERAALSEITQDVYTEGRGPFSQRLRKTKIKQHDKMRALEGLCKHLGLFKGEGEEEDGVQTKAQRLRAALKKILEMDGV